MIAARVSSANIGLVSIPIAQAVKAKGGVVYAFEAQRMLFYALCGSAALNDLENLFVSNRAVGSTPGRITVPQIDYALPRDFGTVSLVNQSAEEPGGEAIELVTIDSLSLPRLDFLKIDVEGMEIEVLQGVRNSLRAHRPWCWIEYWKVSREEIKAQFAGIDYKFFLIDDMNMLCAPTQRIGDLHIQAQEA